MRVRFWGVRGSIPVPGPDTVRYGGNTACLELLPEGLGRRVVIDAGSGIRALGQRLALERRQDPPLELDLFLTHTHWDHIMGFPFFEPLFWPEARIRVFGPVTYEEEGLEKVLGGQLAYRYFPVRLEELSARIEYIQLKEGELEPAPGLKLASKYLNHPLLCLGYRFEWEGRVLATAYDFEPFHNVFSIDPRDPSFDKIMAHEGELAAREENAKVDRFLAGADLLIHDAQYTPEEYRHKTGWGHSTIPDAQATARRAGAGRLALFHHEPQRTDAELDALAEKYLDPEGSSGPGVFFAREGQELAV